MTYQDGMRVAFSITNIQYSYRGNATRKVKNWDFFPGSIVSKEQRQFISRKK
jgi:hypothetical protein